MQLHTVYLGLGSNLGDRRSLLKQASLALGPQVEVKARSKVYETPPWGNTEQPKFLNQVVRGTTYLAPETLLKHLKRLEVAFGRQPGEKNGPRLIDIDILFYDDLVVDTPALHIPHRLIPERAFVLVPLNDLAPDLVHPVTQQTVGEMLAACDTSQIEALP